MGALKRAVQASPRLRDEVRPGKQALEKADRERVTVSGPSLTDSLALDKAYQHEQPTDHRWDYLLGIEDGKMTCVLAMEVHPATPGQVRTVIAKKRGAESTLRDACQCEIVSEWVWVASGSVKISETTTESKLLRKNRIRLVGRLDIRVCPSTQAHQG